MYSEPNHHSRNLKLISILFIVYWLLGLKLIDDNLNLPFIHYQITNPQLLKPLAILLLIYFAWRFHLSSQSKITSGYKNSRSIVFNSYTPNNLKFLTSKCLKDYKDNHQTKIENELADEQRRVCRRLYEYKVKVMPCKLLHGEPSMQDVHVRYIAYYPILNSEKNEEYRRDFNFRLKRFEPLRVKLNVLKHFVFNREESPDYLLPWVLFLFALVTLTFSEFQITAQDVINFIKLS